MRHFKAFSELLYEQAGLSISPQKINVLQAKLNKVMTRKQIATYDELLQRISEPGSDLDFQDLIDIVTVHTTEFFREKEHFDYLSNNISRLLESNPRIMKRGEIRVWAAASSTGQEPVTIAMVLSECMPPGINIKILATDISKTSLITAQVGCYSREQCEDIPKYYRVKYMEPVNEGYRVKEEVQALISYRLFNLMSEFPFKKGFDIIFCRNVMIYFDMPVQQQLIDKISDHLVPGGLLFVGHSESLSNKRHSLSFLGPSIYMK
ncbi:MAG: CheR family methyltransferase [Candidatus Saccharibacteria bacterium]